MFFDDAEILHVFLHFLTQFWAEVFARKGFGGRLKTAGRSQLARGQPRRCSPANGDCGPAIIDMFLLVKNHSHLRLPWKPLWFFATGRGGAAGDYAIAILASNSA